MLRLSLVLAAADLDVAVQPVYFQTIKPRAFVDGRGTVWFLDKTAVHDDTGKKVAVRPSEKHDLILADKAGRFWFWNPYDPAKTGLVYSVGDGVTVTKLAAPARSSRGNSTIAIHEDSAGRVFVRTAKTAHVLSMDGKWDNLRLFETNSSGFTAFVEDPKGRTWMSVAQDQPKVQGGSVGTVGAWCFDGKAWKNHAPADGFPFEQVEYVLPFADDWFVVQEHVDGGYNAPRPRSRLWSPSRTAKEIASATVFADLPTIYALYDGTDLDGNRYLHRPSAAHDGKTSQDKGTFRVSPAGVVTKLTDAEERAIRRQMRVQRNPLLPILAKPGDVQHIVADTGIYDCLGMDKQGRIWFQVHYGDLGSHCLWPAKEKVGDILRLEPFAAMHQPVPRGFVLSGGEAWGVQDSLRHAIEANGDTTTVELAKPPEPTVGAAGYQEDQLLPTLLTTTVLPLGENKALVSSSAGSWVATFRATKVRDIKLEKLAGGVPRNLFRDRTGAVWGWGSPEELLKFDGEKFTAMKAARGPMAITDDGVMWCYAPLTIKLPPGNKRPVSLVRVCGDAVEPFVCKADEIEVGFTKPPKGSAVVWPSEHGLLLVEAQTKPGERPVLRKRAYSESMGGSGVGPPFVVTGSGEILFGSHWGKLFEQMLVG